MKKLILPFVALLIGMAACQKEDTNVLTLEVEHYNGDAKMHIDNQDFAVWDDGDTVWLNETPKRVTVNNTTHQATIPVSSIEDYYYASYPYNAIKITGNSACSITLPKVQTYRENSQGQQIVAAPMLAYCGYEESTLKFRNIGSVLAVKVMNYTYDTLRVHSIQVTADGQNHLWGNGNVGLTGEASLFSFNLSNGDDTVTLDCGDGVEVPAEGKVFYIALPVINEAHLTVKVDDGYGIYTLAQTNNTATFARNTLHQVPFKASESNCEDYAERPQQNSNTIRYSATSQLSGFEEEANVWGKTVVSHDYDETRRLGTITFNSDITEIPESAFERRVTLLSIKLPESVETIRYSAFYYCGSLTSVSMPGVKFVDLMAFAHCSALTTLNLPSIRSIEGDAFYESGIQTITFGPTLSYLGLEIFALCCNITDIYCKAQTPPTCAYDIGRPAHSFTSMNCSPALHVPAGKFNEYSVSSGWIYFYSNTSEDCPTD